MLGRGRVFADRKNKANKSRINRKEGVCRPLKVFWLFLIVGAGRYAVMANFKMLGEKPPIDLKAFLIRSYKKHGHD